MTNFTAHEPVHIEKQTRLESFNIQTDRLSVKSSNKKISFHYSRVGYAYNIVLISLLFGSSFLSIPAVFNIKFPNKPQLVKNIFCIRSLASTSVLLIVWFNECFKQQSIVNIANNIVAIDIANTKLQQIYSIQSINKRVALYFVINWIIWITLIALDYKAFPMSLGITSIPILAPSFICSWFLLRFAFILNQLDRRFEIINNALHKFSNNSTYDCELTVSTVLIDQIKIKDLLIMKRAHELLYQATRNIINHCALSIFLIITLLSGQIIYSAYYFTQLIINPARIWSSLIAFNSSIYLTMEWFPIIIMAVSVTRLTDQIETTPNMLHQIMDQHQNNHQIIFQLKQFSLGLLHRKIPITAYNFIPLDCTLLHSIAGMVTTYLVILLQIQ